MEAPLIHFNDKGLNAFQQVLRREQCAAILDHLRRRFLHHRRAALPFEK